VSVHIERHLDSLGRFYCCMATDILGGRTFMEKHQRRQKAQSSMDALIPILLLRRVMGNKLKLFFTYLFKYFDVVKTVVGYINLNYV